MARSHLASDFFLAEPWRALIVSPGPTESNAWLGFWFLWRASAVRADRHGWSDHEGRSRLKGISTNLHPITAEIPHDTFVAYFRARSASKWPIATFVPYFRARSASKWPIALGLFFQDCIACVQKV